MPTSPFLGCAVLIDGKTGPNAATVRSNAFFILFIFISQVAQLEFSIWTFANQHLEAYTTERDRGREAVRASIAHGENPARVAVVVLEALKSRSPRRRYPVGREAKFLSILKKLAPAQLLDKRIRKQFGLEAARTTIHSLHEAAMR